MNGARDQLLARAILASDQHARRGLCDSVNLLDDRANRRRTADHLVARLNRRLEPLILLRELNATNRVAQRHENAIGIQRLLENVVGAELRGFDGILNRRVPTDHDDDRRRITPAQSLQRFETVHAGHLHVHEDELRLPGLVRGQRLGAARRDAHLVAFELEQLAECGAHAGLVVHHQQSATHRPDLYSVIAPFCTRTSPISGGSGKVSDSPPFASAVPA